jgi:hypothetical protein
LPAIEPTPAQRLGLSSKPAWILWGALHAGVVTLFVVMLLVDRFLPHGRRLPPSMSWFSYVLGGMAIVPVAAGAAAHWRFVRSEPSEHSGIVRRVRERLLAAGKGIDADALALEVVAALAGEFRGRAILAWALAEGGALLAVISIPLFGLKPPAAVVLAVWAVVGLFTAPTDGRREAFDLARLRHAGLTGEQARTLRAHAVAAVAGAPS